MKQFLDKDFLLSTDCAKKLYHDYAENMPIIDYHCHLVPKEIAEDKRYTNITEAWLSADHYKWRAMRACGVDEKYITGNASDYEKFKEYCRIMPSLIGNPLYHWSHLELRRYFDCDLIINEKNCDAIWKKTAEVLARPDMSARGFIRKSNVKLVCTTDDPADSLEYHKIIKDSGFETKVLPAFRPDKGLNIHKSGIKDYFKKLGDTNGVKIVDLDTLEEAYINSLNRFEANGCRTADHGMDDYVPFETPSKYLANEILLKAIKNDGKDITEKELALFKTQMNRFFGNEYKKRGWVLQIHYGVKRSPNKIMFDKLGPDTGFDNIYASNCVAELDSLINYLNENNALPRTVIYSINPVDNAAIGALCGSFCCGDGSNVPTVTQGSAWWFNDNIDGMRAQMRSYANLESLGKFLGMLTDSRSFLSYPRHEYFRRILCDILGQFVENGEYPEDYEALSKIVKDICFNNTKNYFSFDI